MKPVLLPITKQTDKGIERRKKINKHQDDLMCVLLDDDDDKLYRVLLFFSFVILCHAQAKPNDSSNGKH